MKPIWVMIIFMWCIIFVLTFENINLRANIIALQIENATQLQQTKSLIEIQDAICYRLRDYELVKHQQSVNADNLKILLKRDYRQIRVQDLGSDNYKYH